MVFRRIILIIALLLFSLTAVYGQFISSSTALWKPIQYAGRNASDPSNDQGTGARENDIVGTSLIPSAYVGFVDGSATNHKDGTLYFRVRLSGDTGTAGFTSYLWVGIDANNDGKVDIFAGARRQGGTFQNILANPGAGSNTSPGTTTISNASATTKLYSHNSSNYRWAPVSATNFTGTNFNVDNASGTDYFLSFALPFQDLANQLNTTGTGRPSAISITDRSALRFVIATSQQRTAINRDYASTSVTTANTAAFTQLGLLSDATVPLAQTTIPEPGTIGLVVLGVGLLALRRRR